MSMPVITPAEWEVMRIVWTCQVPASTQVIKLMQQKRAWSESTIKTLLRRLVQKGLLATEKVNRHFVYRPLIEEGVAMAETLTATMAQLCQMKRGHALVDLVEQLPLSQADIEALQAVLAAKLPDAPVAVACNCLPVGVSAEDCRRDVKEDAYDA